MPISRAIFSLIALLVIALPVRAFAERSISVDPASQGPGRRVALVIGNSSYRNVSRLENPANDATLMAETLQGLEFVLVGGGALLDLDKVSFENAVQRFGSMLRPGDIALFYYAGHGMQVDGINYLAPVTASPGKAADIPLHMVNSDFIIGQMKGTETHLNILILDACRNNPFHAAGRAVTTGLASMKAPKGTFIAFATQPGGLALDGEGQAHSPYSQALAEAIKHPNFDILHTFNAVGAAVERATNGEQQPWTANSAVDEEFRFNRNGKSAGPTTPIPEPTPPPERWQPEPNPKTEYRVDMHGALNMRSGPGRFHSKVIELPPGTSQLFVSGCRPADDGSNGPPWCDAQWRGNRGWVSQCCIQEMHPTSSPTAKVESDLCDRLAANPNDLNKVTTGVRFDVLSTQAKQAFEICEAAVRFHPAELRFKYQLARALEFIDKNRAIGIYQTLVVRKYPAAFDNLGSLYVRQGEILRGIELFRRGAELNDPDSMVSLAGAIERGYFSTGLVVGGRSVDRTQLVSYKEELIAHAAELTRAHAESIPEGAEPGGQPVRAPMVGSSAGVGTRDQATTSRQQQDAEVARFVLELFTKILRH